MTLSFCDGGSGSRPRHPFERMSAIGHSGHLLLRRQLNDCNRWFECAATFPMGAGIFREWLYGRDPRHGCHAVQL